MSTHKFQLPAIKKPNITAKNTYDFFDYVKKYVTVLSIIFAVILLILHYYDDWKEDLTRLDEFSVTEGLVKKGYTSETIRSKIMLEIEHIINVKTTESSRSSAMLQILGSKPVIKFAIDRKDKNGEYDVNAMIRNIKTWTFVEDKVIRGHFMEDVNDWALLLKKPNGENYKISIPMNQRFDTLISKCAMQIVETMHPQYLIRYHIINNNVNESIRLSKIHDFDKLKMKGDKKMKDDEIKLAKINKILIKYKTSLIDTAKTIIETKTKLEETLKDAEKFLNDDNTEILGYALTFAIYNDISLNEVITDSESLIERDNAINKALLIAIETQKKIKKLSSDFVKIEEIKYWMYSIRANLIGLISDPKLDSTLHKKFVTT
jgi:hypothetical protein